jgi:hypothetical protein
VHHGKTVRALLVVLALLLAACGATPQSQERAAPVSGTPQAVPLVGDVPLRRRNAPAANAPELAIAVFDRGLDVSGQAGGSVFPAVRKAESIHIPVLLAQAVSDSGFYGVVRVVHGPASSVPLTLVGEIIQADGSTLAVAVRLRAADGRTLLERSYRDEARDSDYPVAAGGDPFADLYRAISNDLATVVETLTDRDLERLERLALLDFAARLAPESFADYTAEGDDGVRELRKYPAADDPMLARLQRLRRQEALFVDTVDEQYRELVQRISESYALWRQYTRELALYGATYRDEAAARDRDGRRGSFAALQQAYGSYRKVKLQEEDLLDLVDAFAGESLESVMAVDDGVVRLSGSVDQRYAEWQRLLARIYRLETGAQAP